MDETKLYIKMCDCPEIQEQESYGKDAINSFFYRKEMRYIESKTIWLPRQDQIQEMGNWAISGLAQLIAEDLFPKRAKYLRQKFTSWEQILLAIYMYGEYQKVWSFKEEKWVN